MPSASRSARGPMPDSISSCGVLKAPPASTTSRARGRVGAGRAPRSATDGRGTGDGLSGTDAFGALVAVDQHGVASASSSMFKRPETRAPPPAAARARRCGDARGRTAACSRGREAAAVDRPGVGIGGARFSATGRRQDRQPAQQRASGKRHQEAKRAIAEASGGSAPRRGGRRPSRGRRDRDRACSAPARSAGGGRPRHGGRAGASPWHSRLVAGQLGDEVPVGVVRQHEDHRVVRRAAPQRAGARVEHALARLVLPVAGPGGTRRRSGARESSSCSAGARTRRRGSRELVASSGMRSPGSDGGSPPASSTQILRPASTSRAASAPPPAPELVHDHHVPFAVVGQVHGAWGQACGVDAGEVRMFRRRWSERLQEGDQGALLLRRSARARCRRPSRRRSGRPAD